MLVTYTDDIPADRAGAAWGPFVKIRPKYRDDAGLHAHEREHVLQWAEMAFLGALVFGALGYLWAGPFGICCGALGLLTHNALMRLRAYRLWAEVAAYRKQMVQHESAISLESAAWRLALPLYNLGLRQAEAIELLKKQGGAT